MPPAPAGSRRTRDGKHPASSAPAQAGSRSRPGHRSHRSRRPAHPRPGDSERKGCSAATSFVTVVKPPRPLLPRPRSHPRNRPELPGPLRLPPHIAPGPRPLLPPTPRRHPYGPGRPMPSRSAGPGRRHRLPGLPAVPSPGPSPTPRRVGVRAPESEDLTMTAVNAPLSEARGRVWVARESGDRPGLASALLEGVIAEASSTGRTDLSLVSVDSTTARYRRVRRPTAPAWRNPTGARDSSQWPPNSGAATTPGNALCPSASSHAQWERPEPLHRAHAVVCGPVHPGTPVNSPGSAVCGSVGFGSRSRQGRPGPAERFGAARVFHGLGTTLGVPGGAAAGKR
jgi:hypothetical protein